MQMMTFITLKKREKLKKMVNYSVIKELNYSNKQMFDLIIDVKKYPEFLPWCLSTNLYSKQSNIFYSDMEIGFNLIKEKFTSKVTFNDGEKILSESVSGPFSKMINIWNIKKLSKNKCEITLIIEFEFKSLLLKNLMGKLFEIASKKMIESFEARANELYN
jgi:coenzyme Q-binding protein COQ10